MIRDDTGPLKSFTVEGVPLSADGVRWEPFGAMRLYWHRDGGLVKFLCLDWCSGLTAEWDDDAELSVVFEGWGSRYADEGIRHLHVHQAGRQDMWGYLYYPDTPALCAALMRVHELIMQAES